MTRASDTSRLCRRSNRSWSALGTLAAGAVLLTPLASAASMTAPEIGGEQERYIRVSDLPEQAGIALEISTRTLRHPDGGPEVHLVGVAHIAEGLFFDQRQELLSTYDMVLYEGVGPTWYKLAPDATPKERARVSIERIRHIGTVAEMAKAANGAYPATTAALLETANGYDRRLLAVAMLDAWLRPISYELGEDGQSVRVSSLGADGKPGGEGVDRDLLLSDQPVINPAEFGEMRGMQQMMADATGLVFQLEAMDYVHANWKNADMTIDEFMRAMDANGADASILGLGGGGDADADPGAPQLDWRELMPEGVDPDAIARMLGLDDNADENAKDGPAGDGADDMAAINNQFMNAMSGQGELMAMIQPLFDMLGNNPMMRSAIRLMMIEVLGRADDLMGNDMGGMNPMAGMMDVLLHQRDKVAIDELVKTIDARGDQLDSVALFYGAAHLKGMESTLVEDMGYEVIGTQWAPAISVRYEDMGMPAAQGRMMHQMMLRMMDDMFKQMQQLEQMQGMGN
jgi:hypothetical protein